MGRKRIPLDEDAFVADHLSGLFTIPQLAERYGLSASQVGKILRGERRLDVAEKIEAAIEAARRQAQCHLVTLQRPALWALQRALEGDSITAAIAAAREVLKRTLPEPMPPLPGLLPDICAADLLPDEALRQAVRHALKEMGLPADRLERLARQVEADLQAEDDAEDEAAEHAEDPGDIIEELDPALTADREEKGERSQETARPRTDESPRPALTAQREEKAESREEAADRRPASADRTHGGEPGRVPGPQACSNGAGRISGGSARRERTTLPAGARPQPSAAPAAAPQARLDFRASGSFGSPDSS